MTIYPDADLMNADWTKRSWDLTGIDSVAKLREYLARRGMSVAVFKRTPTYQLAAENPKYVWLKGL